MAFHCTSHALMLPPSPILKALTPFFASRSINWPSFSASVATRAMSSFSPQRVFQLKLDPLTGNSEWVVIADDEHEVPGSSASDGLLASTSYLDMLNDSCRNRAFRLAIEKTITKPCHVLDIGAGTGLLSMMAARAMSSSCGAKGNDLKGIVTACESYLPMVKLMRKIVHINGLGKSIKIINKRSDELEVGTDIASRADVLVSEILDSELLGEGLIPTLQHAHDKLLVENPETVPYRATIYCQLVESTYLSKLRDLHENEAEAVDGIHLATLGFGTSFRIRQQQYATHCDAIEKEIKLLSEPIKIFEFDFWKRPESHAELELPVKATNDGRVHAVVSWWVLRLDREGEIFYSTAPKWISSETNKNSRDWCDHWKQCVWLVPGKGLSVSHGEKVLLHAVHTDTNVLYDLKTERMTTTMTRYGSSDEDPPLVMPPERIGIYGDNKWRLPVLEALRNALQGRFEPLCVVADDSALLTLALLHFCKTARVISLFPGIQEQGRQFLEAVADSNGFSKDRIKVLQKGKADLGNIDTDQKKVDLVIGEPYYYGHCSALPWQNLRFWRERAMLDCILSKDAVTMPCKGILRASAMYLPDLWRSRRCLSKIEGFDHSIANTTLGACGDLPVGKEIPILPYFVWQCGVTKQLSEVITIMEFDFREAIGSRSAKAQVEFSEFGTCHGFVLWIDWVMDTDSSVIVSNGPYKRYWKQGVKLLSNPVEVGTRKSEAACSSAVIEASFYPSSPRNLSITSFFS